MTPTVTFAWTTHAVPFLIAALVIGVLGAYVMRHRDSTVGPPLGILLSAISAWMAGEALMILATTASAKMSLARVCYLPVVLIGPMVLEVMRRYVRSATPEPLSRAERAVVWGVPILTVLMVSIAPGAMWSDFGVRGGAPYAQRVVTYGPWFWILVAHAYGLIATATALFARHVHALGLLRTPDVRWIAAAIAAPWAAVTSDILGATGDFDPTPFGFLLMGVGLVIAFKRTGLLGNLLLGRRAVLDALGEGVLVTDARGHLVDLNQTARRILSIGDGKPTSRRVQEVLSHQPQLLSVLASVDDEAVLDGRADNRERGESDLLGEIELDERTFDIRISPLRDERSQEIHRILSLRDVTERRRVQEALALESIYVRLIQEVTVAANEASSIAFALEESLRLICEACGWSAGHVFQANTDGGLEETGIRWVSSGEAELEAVWDIPDIIAAPSAESLPRRVAEAGRPVVIGDLSAVGDNSRLEAAAGFGLASAIAMPVTIDGQTEALLECASTRPVDPEPELVGVLTHLGELLGRAIERKRAEERIRDLAFYDPLTGLPNRELFRRRLRSAIEHADHCGKSVALLFIDLNGFKLVNDSLGHSAGDALLREVADRFVSCLRPSDVVARSGEQLLSISRLGGDEFTVLLSGITQPQDAALVARRLSDSLATSLVIEGCEVFSDASIGIALYPEDAGDADDLLRNADSAMYVAKKHGAVQWQFYKDSMNRESRRSLDLESRLRRALESGHLHLHYQAQRDTRSGLVVGAEVLARWAEPELGDIGPEEFIPIAERTGLILQIGTWVLQQACLQAMLWRDAGYAPIRIAVNVSGRQIRAGDLPTIVEHTLAQTDLPAELLELEITETALEGDDPVTRDSLERLRTMGVGLALDDFGTGSSSLTHLRTYPIDRLKIDRSFVSGIEQNGDDAALTSAIIAMAHGLRLSVVAEGVDSEAQAEFLTGRDCDELQGYLFSPPLPPDRFERFLERVEKDDRAVSTARRRARDEV